MTIFFNLSVVVYFTFCVLESLNYITLDPRLHVAIKCTPILSLILGVRNKFKSMEKLKQNHHAWRIFTGLELSAIADALLVYGHDVRFFLSGLLFFLVAILFYMQGFGWKKLELQLLPIFFIFCNLAYYVVFEVMSEIPLELKIGCLIYVEVGQIAIWRAWARVDWKNVKKGETEDLLAAIGVLFFAASDFTLAVNKFAFPVPYSRYIVMSTYYFAQYAISSAVRNQTKSKRR